MSNVYIQITCDYLWLFQAFHSIAKCVAALTMKCPGEVNNVVTQFVKDVKNSKSTDSIRFFALLALGEIGKHM